jgi:uncharacterized protein YutE (UPF0331/DUF86 family)
LTTELERTLRAAVGLRDALVHGYTSVDVGIVKDVLEHRLDDLLSFVAAIRQRIGPVS